MLIKGLATESKTRCTSLHRQARVWVRCDVVAFAGEGADGDDDDLPSLIPASMLKKTPAPTPFPASSSTPASASASSRTPSSVPTTGSSAKGSSASGKPRKSPVKTSLTPPPTHTHNVTCGSPTRQSRSTHFVHLVSAYPLFLPCRRHHCNLSCSILSCMGRCTWGRGFFCALGGQRWRATTTSCLR